MLATPDLVAVETTHPMSALHVTRTPVRLRNGHNGRRALKSAAVVINHVRACVMAVVQLVAISRVNNAISRHANGRRGPHGACAMLLHVARPVLKNGHESVMATTVLVQAVKQTHARSNVKKLRPCQILAQLKTLSRKLTPPRPLPCPR